MKDVIVVGLGAMGARHARVLKELGRLGAVTDMDLNKAKQLGALYDVPYYPSLDDDGWQLGLKAAVIATPTPFHAATATNCISAGLDVLVEKPITLDLDTAFNLESHAGANRKILSVGYIERYNPAFRALESMMKEGILGQITSITAKRVGGAPRSADNIILDLMTHDLNLLYTLFGCEPKNISTFKLKQNGIVNSAQTLMSFWGQVSATCEANWISPVKIRKWEVTGTKGYCEVNLINQQITQYKSNVTIDNPNTGFANFLEQYGEPCSTVYHSFQKEPLKEELNAFLKAVDTRNTSDIVLGVDGRSTLRVTLAVNDAGDVK